MRKFFKNFSWLISPIVSVLLGLLFIYLKWINLCSPNYKDVISGAITAVGIITGILITNYTIILSLPEDRASVKVFRQHNYFKILTKHIFFGTLWLIFALLISITTANPIVMLIPFFAGVGNLITSGYILYNILQSLT